MITNKKQLYSLVNEILNQSKQILIENPNIDNRGLITEFFEKKS